MNDRYFLYGGKPFDCKTETYNSSTFFGKCHWLQRMFRKCLLVFAEKYFGTSLFWFLVEFELLRQNIAVRPIELQFYNYCYVFLKAKPTFRVINLVIRF